MARSKHGLLLCLAAKISLQSNSKKTNQQIRRSRVKGSRLVEYQALVRVNILALILDVAAHATQVAVASGVVLSACSASPRSHQIPMATLSGRPRLARFNGPPPANSARESVLVLVNPCRRHANKKKSMCECLVTSVPLSHQ